ncbi:Avirulence (Avh) protein [Phytophthora megakarya]|uniref:RxLR effector protein n=1 Tax=Phytophthora megakarya TaxID=4795 RepID=A0A225WW10_9STRA|nr:Avirulence (Avh) protein [Phytophthora megakarya]
MWVHYVVLLGVAAVTTSTNGLLAKDSTSDVPVHSVLGVQSGASTNRFLRIQDGTAAKEEERMFNMGTYFANNKNLANYLKNNKDVDDVFVKLKLNVPSKNIFEDPKFLKWSQYVEDFNQKNSNKEPKSMLPTLLKHYKDFQLSTMLEAATRVDNTRDMAMKLQSDQMKLWKSRGYTPDDVFHGCKLDILDGGLNLLANPRLAIWMKYTEFNPRTTTLFDTLHKTYPDQWLSQILVAGMNNAKTYKLAKELQTQQVNRWLNDRELPTNVFKFLSLNQGPENLLANPQLYTFVKYAERFKANHVDTTKVTLFDALRTHYTDDALVTMLNSALHPTSIREDLYAKYVQDALLSKWAEAPQPKPISKVLNDLGKTPAKINELELAYIDKLLARRSKFAIRKNFVT